MCGVFIVENINLFSFLPFTVEFFASNSFYFQVGVINDLFTNDLCFL